MAASANAATLVTFETNYGKIQLELYPDKAPVTVKNFVSYVESGFYNGTIFHRVIPGFMIQGGGMTAEMVEKDTQDPITNEADNGLKNDKYTIAMARTPDPNSATAQFFINVVDNDFLNFRNKSTSGYGYAVFGKVITGMDTVDKIAKVQTKSERGHQDVPAKDVIITKATVAFSTDKEKK
ncbi:MAG: peptidyl-prolyl cis-trans isomerase [Deferribacteraceae bacterium]|nr:peptidyl-prolyl cis-trans isomerase [Deferribacteraceae bacterium]